MTVRGQSFIDNGLSTRFVTHVPQRRDDWDKGFKDKVYHISTQLLYQHGTCQRRKIMLFWKNIRSRHIYDDFLRLLFLDAHREASALSNDIPEESGHFRFLRTTCLANIKGSVGLILAKASAMRISIPLDLSSRPFIPPPCFLRSRRSTTLLTPSLVFSPLCSA